MLSKLAPLIGCLALILPAAVSNAAEMVLRGVSYPFFNEAGQLTHRIIADSATKNGEQRKLSGVLVEYFEAGDPKRVTQRITASEATWSETRQTLAGDGAIVIETDVNRLSGEGFLFTLPRSQVEIQRRFAMSNDEVDLTSDRAIVDLVLERDGKGETDVRVRDIKRCEAIGNLHLKVRPAARGKYEVDEARSERAVYDGPTHTIKIPQNAQMMHKGRPWTSSEFTYTLDQKSRPALKLAK
ncbi:MAG TPA: hypothetical protein VGE76_05000 [Opitutaceae bacterium]